MFADRLMAGYYKIYEKDYFSVIGFILVAKCKTQNKQNVLVPSLSS